MLNIALQHKMMMKLSPQQVQYLKMLQLPTLALEQKIKAELEMNPLLEEGFEEEQEILQEEGAKDEASPEEQQESKTEEPKEAEEDKYTIDDYMNDDPSGFKTQQSFDDEEDDLLGQEIIGNVDEDGYLRRDLAAIVQDLNLTHNTAITMDKAEGVLKKIQHLDPVGIGSRTLQECLVVQLESSSIDPQLKNLAHRILTEFYEDFTMRHFEDLAKKLGVSHEELKRVIDLIQHLNPKPGEGQFSAQENYVVPDFIVTKSEEDFIITLNDRNIPPLRINRAYKELMSKRKKNGVSAEAKDFIRQRFEAAKWFISSIHQRRETMLKVMRTIVDKQREFFETGEGLRPMIYKDISEVIMMDISTISRVVNSKYVQTDYGVFSLRHFFSDSISTADGEEVSNKEVKKKLKALIDAEDPHKPLSDHKLGELLNAQGLNIARRTVAKYREAMQIPVARLRRRLA
jgi:RNA polymerase sigma-54 factor